MSRHRIMFAVTSAGEVGPAVMDKVIRLAMAFDAELELFHCIFDGAVSGPERFGSLGAQQDIHEFVKRRREQLEHWARRLRVRGVRIRTSVRWDYPIYQGIVRQALRHRPSLLIAQSARRGRLARLLIRQTDYRLIESCPCPLLFIKTDRPYSDPLIVAAVDPAHSHDKPAALDEAIVDTAVRMRDALGGRLTVLHAAEAWEDAVRTDRELGNLPAAELEDAQGAYWNAARDKVLSLARRHAVPASAVEVLEGDAAELLPRIVRRDGTHILVLGAVSRSRLGRAVIGHTAERVLDALECDLLVVKPPAFRTHIRPGSIHHIARPPARQLQAP